MMAWSNVAFHMQDEDEVVALKAQSCITEMKHAHKGAGKIYGYLSTFSHWGHAIHGNFLDFNSEGVGVLSASVRYRAMALALCVVILDVFIEVVRRLYVQRSDALVMAVQGVLDRNASRKTHRMLSSMVDLIGSSDLYEIQSFLSPSEGKA
jgi:hypothetical protein